METYSNNLKFSSEHKVLKVLSALRDVIIDQQNKEGISFHEPTPTEYFAVITTTLTVNIETDHLYELLQVFEFMIPNSSKTVVQYQSKSLFPILLQLANACTQITEHTRILRSILSTLGSLLLIQEASDAVWNSRLSLSVINALLGFIDDGRSKLQNAVHTSIIKLIKCHMQCNYSTVRNYIADFCVGVMKSCTRSEYKRSLCVIALLTKGLGFFPANRLEQLIRQSLNLDTCDQPALTSAVYRMIDSFFQSPENPCNTSQIYLFINILLDKRPGTLDMEANTYYCTSCASAVSLLSKTKIELDIVPTMIQVLLLSCDSEFMQVHCAVSTSIKRIIQLSLTDTVVEQSITDITLNRKIKTIIQSIETILQLRYQQSWFYILDCVRYVFEKFRGEQRSNEYVTNLVIESIEIYQAIDSQAITIEKPSQSAVEDTVSAALRNCGVDLFLTLVPLKDSSKSSRTLIDPSKEWILRILHSNLKLMPCQLSSFGKHILSLASIINKQIKSGNLSIEESSHHRLRVIQLWSLFPEFCYYGPTDIAQTFPNMPNILDGILKDESYPELHAPILRGLTLLAKISYERRIQTDIDILRKHSSSIIGMVLTLLEQVSYHDRKYQYGIECIGSWIAIASKKIVDSIAKKLLQLLLQSTTELQSSISQYAINHNDQMDEEVIDEQILQQQNTASGWMAIFLVIIPHLSSSFIELLYRTIRPLLLSSNTTDDIYYHPSIQKRAYHVLEGLLKHHALKLFDYENSLDILQYINKSISTCAVSTRSIRLKCLEILLKSIVLVDEKKQAVDRVFSSILVCLKDTNKKTRDEAQDLLRSIIKEGSDIQNDEEMNDAMMWTDYHYDLFRRLSSSVNGESSMIRSAALIGLCMLLLEKRDDETLLSYASEFLSSVSSLLQHEPSPEETRGVLSYVKVLTSILPVEKLSKILPEVIYTFTNGLNDKKSNYLSRCRAIMRKLVRRLPEESIRQCLPESDHPLLLYVLRMNRRTIRRHKDLAKDKLQQMLGSDSDDSDNEDDEEEETDTKLKSRPKAQRSDDLIKSFKSSDDDIFGDDSPSYRVSSAKTDNGENNKARNNRTNNKAYEKAKENDDEDDDDFEISFGPDGRVTLVKKDEKDKNEVAEDDKKTGSTKPTVPPLNTASKKRSREPGEEYRSKRAGGDVWKKGMLEPHAYIALDPRLMTNKNRREALTKIGSVITKKSQRKNILKNINGKRRNVTVGNRKQRLSVRKHTSNKSV